MEEDLGEALKEDLLNAQGELEEDLFLAPQGGQQEALSCPDWLG